MRILLDGCIWWKVPEDLRQAGHDVEWVGDWPSDPGDPDAVEQAVKHHIHEVPSLMTGKIPSNSPT